jgi:hypothetical protein
MRWNAQQLGDADKPGLRTGDWKQLGRNRSAFAALEEFHLPEPLFRFFLGFVGTAEILLAVLGKNFVAARNFLNHCAPLKLDAQAEDKSCHNSAFLDKALRHYEGNPEHRPTGSTHVIYRDSTALVGCGSPDGFVAQTTREEVGR